MFFFVLCSAPAAAATHSPEPSYAGAADTYAVVEIGGHQLIVEEGRWYTVNRLEASLEDTWALNLFAQGCINGILIVLCCS